MSLPYNLDDVRAVPGLYLPRTECDVTVAYVQGVDAASHNSLLLGFREYLVLQRNGGNKNASRHFGPISSRPVPDATLACRNGGASGSSRRSMDRHSFSMSGAPGFQSRLGESGSNRAGCTPHTHSIESQKSNVGRPTNGRPLNRSFRPCTTRHYLPEYQ
jgi:hypothetical protein